MLGLIEIVGVSIDEVHRFSAQSGDSKSAQRISEPMHKYGRTQEAANRLERIASDFCHGSEATPSWDASVYGR